MENEGRCDCPVPDYMVVMLEGGETGALVENCGTCFEPQTTSVVVVVTAATAVSPILATAAV